MAASGWFGGGLMMFRRLHGNVVVVVVVQASNTNMAALSLSILTVPLWPFYPLHTYIYKHIYTTFAFALSIARSALASRSLGWHGRTSSRHHHPISSACRVSSSRCVCVWDHHITVASCRCMSPLNRYIYIVFDHRFSRIGYAYLLVYVDDEHRLISTLLFSVFCLRGAPHELEQPPPPQKGLQCVSETVKGIYV